MFTQVYFFLIKQWNRAWESELGVGSWWIFGGEESGFGKKWQTPVSQIWLSNTKIFLGSKICRDEGVSGLFRIKESGVEKARDLEQETQSTDSQRSNLKKNCPRNWKNCQFFILWGRNFPLFFWCKSQINWDISLRLPHILYGSML